MSSQIATGALARAYIKAKLKVLEAGYGSEIVWQKNLRFEELTEADLLRECAWVILVSGMRESVVRRTFPGVSQAFLGWNSAREIARNRYRCTRLALVHFANERKIEAIAETAQMISAKGFEILHGEIAEDPLLTLERFPYIGPATCYHVAKNIGLSVAKPDRHLCRLAALTGYDQPYDLCQAIAAYIGDPVSVVDIVLWRFATMHRDYLSAFLRS